MVKTEFQDGQTALWEEKDLIIVCKWMSDDGEYFAGDEVVEASQIRIGDYVLGICEQDDRNFLKPVSRVVTVPA
jgi:hypothetical protein